MKTFEEAMTKFRDCSDDARDPYRGIVNEVAASEVALSFVRSAVIGNLAEVLLDPAAGARLFMYILATGVMVGIEMEKRDEGVQC